MVNEQNRTAASTYQISAEQARQEARRQERMLRIQMGMLTAGGVALATGLIPMNDVTIMLAMVLGCGALLCVLYRK
ncbi:MAG: hypothetical protein ACI4ML_13240 [Aristaeellaceae bacterium]